MTTLLITKYITTMNRIFLLSCILVTSVAGLWAQPLTLNYYLPQSVTYDPAIPTPASILGYQVGEWHVSHDQLVYYMRALAQASDRVTLTEFGRTYEQRPLLYLTITSPDNHRNLDAIREAHVALTNPKAAAPTLDDMPVVLYQGYSIHGNEPSGGNAALLYAYYLAAAQGDSIEQQLQNAIILLDPCFNPDGFNRFASWVNTHKSATPVSDPQERQYDEAWPRGRTNHYWFDLNRDWLLVQHPESRGRIDNFHHWKPNVLTDHHEMGTNSTFFFQPGIPERTHPLTPARNQQLTQAIGTFHAKHLDRIGSLYYAKESFDDYYYGKGSTYPDINGAIGILFEQASSRGHQQESVNGLLTFPFTIRNQFTTSLSTLDAATRLRLDLLQWQRDFYRSAQQESQSDEVAGYILGDAHDPQRTQGLIEILLRHQIEVYRLRSDEKVGEPIATIGDMAFTANAAYVIPTAQPQYRLIKAIFEERTTFGDSLFYDVSGFNLALAFDVPYAACNARNFPRQNWERIRSVEDLKGHSPKGQIVGGPSTYAYLLRWDAYRAPALLGRILRQGWNAKVANDHFTLMLPDGEQTFGTGTILLPVAQNTDDPQAFYLALRRMAEAEGVTVYAAHTGFSQSGIMLGSPSWSALRTPKIMLVVGDGVSSYDAGEVWHLLDHTMHLPVTKIPADEVSRADLSRYNVIILPDGRYPNDMGNALKDWAKAGNTLISYRGAIEWGNQHQLARGTRKRAADKVTASQRAYAHIEADRGSNYIGGAIVATTADLTHPLLYGYHREELAVFHRGTTFWEVPENPYATPLRYTDAPLRNGYVSRNNLDAMAGSAAMWVNRVGSGRNVCLNVNTNFRAFWWGTHKLLLNAIYFGHTIDRGATVSAEE